MIHIESVYVSEWSLWTNEFGMKDPSKALPLTTLTYHILLALADRDRHGYSIIKEAEQRTGQSMRIETGALYHAIRRMRNEELIEPAPANERESVEDTRRRTYRLTKWGREVLGAESTRLRQLVDIAEAKQVLQARTT
jgi:DNA-binding PadR family transcriptional regulator